MLKKNCLVLRSFTLLLDFPVPKISSCELTETGIEKSDFACYMKLLTWITLFGYLAIWHFGYLAIWLFGYLALTRY